MFDISITTAKVVYELSNGEMRAKNSKRAGDKTKETVKLGPGNAMGWGCSSSRLGMQITDIGLT